MDTFHEETQPFPSQVINPRSTMISAGDILDTRWVLFDPVANPGGSLEPDRVFGPYRISAGTDAGRNEKKNKRNQDSYAISRVMVENQDVDETLLLVADGLGNDLLGKEAGELAIHEFQMFYAVERKTQERAVAQVNAMQHAQKKVQEWNVGRFGEDEDKFDRTTLLALVLGDDGTYSGINVGDGRAYVIGENTAQQVGSDDNFASMRARQGYISPEAVYKHPNRHIILQSLGRIQDLDLRQASFEGNFTAGDQMLLCSDGLWQMTKDADGRNIHRIARSSGDQKEVVRRLIAFANQQGGEDHVTVVCAKKQI